MGLPYRLDAPDEVLNSKYYSRADLNISCTFRDDNDKFYGYISLCRENKLPEIGNAGCRILELYLNAKLDYETIYSRLELSLYNIWIDMQPNIFKYHWIYKNEPNSDLLKQFFLDCDFGEFIETDDCYILKLDYVSHD